MSVQIQIKRGLQADVASLTLREGELALALDSGNLYAGLAGGKQKLITSSGMTKTDVLDTYYPVGTIYSTTNSLFDPAAAFGGVWEIIEGAKVDVDGYVSLDGAWTKVSSLTISVSQATGTDQSKDRYYLTAAQLHTLFGAYGFRQSDYTETSAEDLSRHFPSGTIKATGLAANDSKVWADAGGSPGSDFLVYAIQLKNRDMGIAIYYVPNVTHVGNSYFEKTDETVLADNAVTAVEESTAVSVQSSAVQAYATTGVAETYSWTRVK